MRRGVGGVGRWWRRSHQLPVSATRLLSSGTDTVKAASKRTQSPFGWVHLGEVMNQKGMALQERLWKVLRSRTLVPPGAHGPMGRKRLKKEMDAFLRCVSYSGLTFPDEIQEAIDSDEWNAKQREAMVSTFLQWMYSEQGQADAQASDKDDQREHADANPEAEAEPWFSETDPLRQHEHMQQLYADTDLTTPHLWFPLARSIDRKIIFHMGPTNSGKTFRAINALAAAGSGVYCAPLRLLAWEVKEKLTDKGVATNLFTGQEQELTPGSCHVSCTIEMANTQTLLDVAVIDEIQLLDDENRGWAWTRALLGLAAKEVHVCGAPATLDLLQRLCALTGEELVVREYKRMSQLDMDKPVESLSEIRKGDCVIAFSRVDLFDLKLRIERSTGMKCCIVYGSLPPDTRKEQAKLFNDPDSGYDVLVASDAIGMGLNLNIDRVVFAAVEKFDGTQRRKLDVHEVLQIAGRAGRGDRRGLVSATGASHDFLKHMLSQQPPPLTRAQVQPSHFQLAQFMASRPLLQFETLLQTFIDHATTHSDLYRVSGLSSMLENAKLLDQHHVDLDICDRLYFYLSPCNVSNEAVKKAFLRYAMLKSFGMHVDVGIKMFSRVANTPMQAQRLEDMFKVLDLYLWLGMKFGEAGGFVQTEQARDLAQEICRVMQRSLEKMVHTTKSDRFEVVSEHRRRKKRAAAGRNGGGGDSNRGRHRRSGGGGAPRGRKRHDLVQLPE